MGKKGNAEFWFMNVKNRMYFIDGRIRLKWMSRK
jgi:hypothetical protein